MATVIAVASTDELAPGLGKLVGVQQRRIALFNVGGCYYALDDRCPHRGAPLSAGELAGETVVCPWHGAVFNLGRGTSSNPQQRVGPLRMTYISVVQRLPSRYSQVFSRWEQAATPFSRRM